MKRSGNKLAAADVKAMDMVSFLSSIGIEPTKIRNNDYWYLSPLRDENTASFKVNRSLNRWYDHGMGKGGNLIDFGILYFNCSVKDLLQKIDKNFSFHQYHTYKAGSKEKEREIIVLNSFMIASYGLIKYLSERKIPLQVAERFCREVRFTVNEKTYYAIGFKNDSGGYELRNAFLKLSSSPKGVTTIRNGSGTLCVFEGFFDFLSYITLYENPETKPDFLILNSLSFFEKYFVFMEQYELIRLFLDRDTTGQNCSRMATARNIVYRDESCRYKDFKDMNDWMIHGHP